MAKYCLYCSLRFSDTTNFCPNCGRPIEKDFSIRPNQETGLVRHKEFQKKDDLIRHLGLTKPMPGKGTS